MKTIRMLCVLLTVTLSTGVSALVISVDDVGGFGADALTRDTEQGLDFLDLMFSAGRSYNDISTQFAPGGDFAGFRYATLDEVIALVNQFGVSPAVSAGTGTNIASDLAGLVDMLGATNMGTYNRSATGITATPGPGGTGRRMVELLDEYDSVLYMDRVTSEPVFSINDALAVPTRGSFLVKSSVIPVSEPASFLMLLLASLITLSRQRRRR